MYAACWHVYDVLAFFTYFYLNRCPDASPLAARRGTPHTDTYVMVFLRNYALALACIPFGSVGRAGRKTNMRYVYVAAFKIYLPFTLSITIVLIESTSTSPHFIAGPRAEENHAAPLRTRHDRFHQA